MAPAAVAWTTAGPTAGIRFKDKAVLLDKDGELLGHMLQQQNHTKLN